MEAAPVERRERGRELFHGSAFGVGSAKLPRRVARQHARVADGERGRRRRKRERRERAGGHYRATRGGERRNTAACDKGISLGVCRTILGISVNDAGSIFWCARARRLVYSAAQRAQRAVSSLAQWQRPRMWIYVAAPHRTTKPSWGGDAQAGLMRI